MSKRFYFTVLVCIGGTSTSTPWAYAQTSPDSVCSDSTQAGFEVRQERGRTLKIYSRSRTQDRARDRILALSRTQGSSSSGGSAGSERFQEAVQRLTSATALDAAISEPLRCTVGETQLQTAIASASQTLSQLASGEAIFDILKQRIDSASVSNGFAYPDPRVPFQASDGLKTASGQPVAGDSPAEKLRHWSSEQFERLARIYVSGSESLARDTGAPYASSAQPILGLYQGYAPDLLFSTPARPIYFERLTGWNPCGVANPENRWFKFPDGSVSAESVDQNGRIRSHLSECASGYSAPGSSAAANRIAATSRGKLVNLYMLTMEKMKSAIDRGIVPEAQVFGALNRCTEIKAKINAFRSRIVAIQGEIQTDHQRAGFDGFPQCQSVSNLSSQDQSQKGTSAAQTRACILAGMQANVEAEMVSRFAHCNWQSVTTFFYDEVKRAILE